MRPSGIGRQSRRGFVCIQCVGVATPIPFSHETLEIRRKRALPSPEEDIVEAWRTGRKRVKLPSVEDLYGLLELPLADSEKIPITERMFDALVSKLSPDKCSPQDVRTLFKIGETPLDLIGIYSAVAHPGPKSGTDKAFISLGDKNIRNILELLIPSGTSIRSDKEAPNMRPDFGFLLGTICPFRGEERGSEDAGDPKAELVQKVNWVCDPVPYMLGQCSHSVHPRLDCFHSLLLPRIPDDPLCHYCTYDPRKPAKTLRPRHRRFGFQEGLHCQHMPPYQSLNSASYACRPCSGT